jgi:hypothetical protein
MIESVQPPEEVHVLTSSSDLDDYDILSTQTMSVAVPHSTTESFRKLIWAAMAAYGFGNSSVDHVMRRYGHLWDRRKDKSFERDARTLALRGVVTTVKEIADALDRVPVSGLGQVCAKSALARLEATFKAAYGLVSREYVFEVDALTRLILEQMAWASVAFSKDDDTVFKLEAPKCMHAFRAHFPDCGRLYGRLSESAHIDPSIARNYVSLYQAGSDVVRRSAMDSFDSGVAIVQLAPVYAALVQRLFCPLEAERAAQIAFQLGELRDQYLRAHPTGGDEVGVLR